VTVSAGNDTLRCAAGLANPAAAVEGRLVPLLKPPLPPMLLAPSNVPLLCHEGPDVCGRGPVPLRLPLPPFVLGVPLLRGMLTAPLRGVAPVFRRGGGAHSAAIWAERGVSAKKADRSASDTSPGVITTCLAPGAGLLPWRNLRAAMSSPVAGRLLPTAGPSQGFRRLDCKLLAPVPGGCSSILPRGLCIAAVACASNRGWETDPRR